MGPQRIEQALRDGPPNEPRYVPGSFRRDVLSQWSLAVGGAFVAVALVLGVAAGLGIGVLRSPGGNVGNPPDLEAIAAELQGAWVSDAISRDDWVSGLVSMGHDIDDVDNFLIHDPIVKDVTYFLTFSDGTLNISSSLDGAPVIENSDGPYRLLPEGRLSWEDLGCFVTADVTVDGDRLTFEPVETESCGADERVANSAFFNLAPYERAPAR